MKTTQNIKPELICCIKTLLTSILLFLMFNVVASAQSANDSSTTIRFSDERFKPLGKTYISQVNYEKKGGKVYARIVIQHPSPPMSSCGPMCFRSTVVKRLNADGNSFYVISEGKSVAVDKNKVFILGMEKNEQENKAAYEEDSRKSALIIPSLVRTDYDIFDADPATLKTIREDYDYTYFKDKNNVYYMFDRILDANAKTFEYIKNGYAKDNKSVFYKNKLIKNSNANTFEFLDYAFAKDANQVYFNGKIMKMYDAPSFAVVHVFQNYYVYNDYKQHYYLKDKNGVYINNEKIPFADYKSFEMIYDMNDLDTLNMYAKDKNHVFWGNKILQGADANSFKMEYDESKKEFVFFDKNYSYKNGEKIDKIASKQKTKKEKIPLGHIYSISTNGDIYCWDKKIEGADFASFSVIDAEGYAKDKNHIYYLGIPLNNSPETFNIAKRKDDKAAYYRDQKVEGADVETYVKLGTDYGKDKKQGYFEGKPIKGSDGSTFVFHGSYLSQDAKHVYFQDKILKGANPNEKYKKGEGGFITFGQHNVWYMYVPTNLNPKTFKEEGNSYFKDDKKVLYLNHTQIIELRILKDVDAQTFVALDALYEKQSRNSEDERYWNASDYGKDKNYVYYKGILLPNSDAKTFIFLNDDYTKDKNNVYYKGEIIKDADSKTFKKIDKDGYRWMDKNNTFVSGKKVE